MCDDCSPSICDVDNSRGLSRRSFLHASALGATAFLGTQALGGRTAWAANAAQPSSLQLSNGTELVLLGTAAGPPPEIGRTGIASALSVRGKTYVVDCGRSAVTRYLESGLAFRSLQAIFLTHLHADHVGDYYNFFLFAGYGDNEMRDGIFSPVQVYGSGPAGGLPQPFGGGSVPTINPVNPTPGLADLTHNVIDAFAYSNNIFMRDSRIADVRTLIDVHEISLPNVGASYKNTAPLMKPFPVMEDDRVRVSAVLVPHGPVFPSFAFRFDTDDGSIVFSGDTSLTPNIIMLARGADILVHEAIDLTFYEKHGTAPAQLSHLQKSHTPVTKVGHVAQEAGVRTLVLTHLSPSTPRLVTDTQWKRQAQIGFSGRVFVGNDLMRLPLLKKS
jgi:ribonuclease BN (tRNA processing enzyme)